MEAVLARLLFHLKLNAGEESNTEALYSWPVSYAPLPKNVPELSGTNARPTRHTPDGAMSCLESEKSTRFRHPIGNRFESRPGQS